MRYFVQSLAGYRKKEELEQGAGGKGKEENFMPSSVFQR